MKGVVLLPKISVRGFVPRTYGEDDVAKKVQIRDLLRAKIGDLTALQSQCRGKRLWLEITFYLYGGSALQGRAGKDIDNLLKIVLDALPKYMDRARMQEGLGLILEDKDEMVFEIHAEKELVYSESDEGIDIEIAEWIRGRLG